MHARVLQPDISFEGLAYDQILKTAAGLERIGVLHEEVVCARCAKAREGVPIMCS